MKSKYKIEKLGNFIKEVSVRNNKKVVSEVFSVTNSEGFIKSTDYFEKEVFSKNISNYKIVKPNQFAYNPSRINVGSIDYLRTDFEVAISPLYISFQCNKYLREDFLLRYLRSPIGNSQIRNKTRGAVRDNLTFARLSEITIPIPSVAEQLKISKLLSKIDSLIEKRRESAELIDALMQSHYYRIFGDPVTNPKHWKKLQFSEVAKNENSKRVPIKQSDRDKRSGDYQYYGATGVIDTIDDYIFDGEFLLIAEDGKNLLLRRKNNAFLVRGKFWVNNHAHVLTYNGITNLRYLEYFLNYLDLKPFLTGIDQVKLNKENLEKIQVPVPPLELQNEFSNIVHQTEVIKNIFQSSLNFLEELYNVISYRAFRGELDLSRIELDHIVPRSQGGSDVDENVNLTAKIENRKIASRKGSVLKILVNKHFRTRPFSFEELAEKIQASLVEEEYDYDKIKNEVFSSLKGKGEIKLKQIFNEKEKKLLLQADK